MTSQVDRDVRVTETGQLLPDTVPEPSVGCEAVHQQEWRARKLRAPQQGAQDHAIEDGHPQPDDPILHETPVMASPPDPILVSARRYVQCPPRPILSGRTEMAGTRLGRWLSYRYKSSMIAGMKTVTALDLRRHVGQLLDEASAGERIVIERAGQPLCALVPLRDLEATDPAAKLKRQLAALDELRRLARRYPAPEGFDAVDEVREGRRQRDDQITRAFSEARDRRKSR